MYLKRSPQSFEWPAPRNCRLCRIISRQCLRFPANSRTSSSTMSGSPVNSAASSKTHFNQVFLGRPRDLLPCAGVQSSKYLGSLVSGILETCPNQRRRFALMYRTTGFMLYFSGCLLCRGVEKQNEGMRLGSNNKKMFIGGPLSLIRQLLGTINFNNYSNFI